MIRTIILLMSIIIACNSAYALDIDPQLQQALDSFAKNTKYTVKGVSRTPTPGLYVVLTDIGPMIINYEGKLILTKKQAFHTNVKGSINGKELKQIRLEAMSEIDEENIIVIKHGTGENKLIMYSAVDCPYCLQQEQNLLNSKENATILLVPTVLEPSNWPIVNRIMCSNDRASAWTSYMINKKLPDNNGQCYWSDNFSFLGTNQYSSIVMQTVGTPQMIYRDGKLQSPKPGKPLGYLPTTAQGPDNIFDTATIETDYFSKEVYTPPKKSIFSKIFK